MVVAPRRRGSSRLNLTLGQRAGRRREARYGVRGGGCCFSALLAQHQ